MKVGHIVRILESLAPPALQESYDNTGLIIGSAADECSEVLLCVDVTPRVVDEALQHGIDMIVSHHPLIFKGLKSINDGTPQGKAVAMCLRHGVAVYACHTAIDSAWPNGMSHRMAHMLGLVDTTTLVPQTANMLRLTVYVPSSHAEAVRQSLFDAGAGHIGNYDCCSYSFEGKGSYRPLSGSNPWSGTEGVMHTADEISISVIVPRWLMAVAEQAIRRSHPYEVPAYEFTVMEGAAAPYGLGAVGNLTQPISALQLVERVKATFNSPVARCTRYPSESIIRRVALCTGSGQQFVGNALRSGATAYITSDTSYHTFVDYAEALLLIDIGHHESENCAKDIFYDVLSENLPNFAIRKSIADSNPIQYL